MHVTQVLVYYILKLIVDVYLFFWDCCVVRMMLAFFNYVLRKAGLRYENWGIDGKLENVGLVK